MDLGAEIAALRARRAASAASQEAARSNFEREVRDLWDAAERFWREHPGIRMDATYADYIRTGEFTRNSDRRLVPPPFPESLIFTRTRSLSEWESASPVPTTRLPAIVVHDWFAICPPGEIRELIPRGPHESLTSSLARSYLRSDEHTVTVPEQDAGSYSVRFRGPAGLPDVALRCDSDGPIEIHTGREGAWQNKGTLRAHVVAALDVAARRWERKSAAT